MIPYINTFGKHWWTVTVHGKQKFLNPDNFCNGPRSHLTAWGSSAAWHLMLKPSLMGHAAKHWVQRQNLHGKIFLFEINEWPFNIFVLFWFGFIFPKQVTNIQGQGEENKASLQKQWDIALWDRLRDRSAKKKSTGSQRE